MKIYFVGMHNKEGMKPLDSRTLSGKIIDRCIGMLDLNEHYDCVKTNLCDTGYEPKTINEIQLEALRWHARLKPEWGSVVVLLGGFVKKHFIEREHLSVIKCPHPAWRKIRGNSDWYVDIIKKEVDRIYKANQEIINPFQTN